MICGIYSRKSHDQGGISEDAKSITRQIEHARAYAVRKGWRVSEDHIYVDDGISGAEFAKRPGVVRLMNAITPAAPFGALIMSEESRLGRESIETAYLLKQLIGAGVRVFYYLEDKERTLNGALEKAMMALQGMADEMEREKASQRVIDAMLRKARAGQVCGGRVFGFSNVRIDASAVMRQVNEAEAAVVRRIFALCAQGVGYRAIAYRLNDEAAPAPTAQQGRPVGWASSSVREVLFRELYRGRLVYNRTRKRDRFGRKKQAARPEAEWIVVDVPASRIVPEAAWAAAHAQITKRRAAYGCRRNPDAWARPAVTGPKATRYLLAGLARCGACGGGFISRSRSHGSTRQYRYGCGCNWTRGRRACANAREILMATADTAIRGLIEADVVRPTVLDRAIDLALAATETPAAATDRRRTCDTAIAALDRELVNLTGLAAAGGDVPALVAGLRERQARRDALVVERSSMRADDAPRVDREGLRAALAAKLDDWRAVLAQPGGERRVLETMLDGRIVFTPAKNAHGFDAYHVRVPLALDRLFEGELPMDLASPTGFEPVSWP